MNELNIVIGANYGDEGKGLVTNAITPSDGVVVLGNGGAQRGHTAEYNGVRHVFHHFGSATLKGAATYASEDFLVNPMEYVREVSELGFIPILHVHPNCRVTTIYDMLANAIRSELSGKTGSTGFGVLETIKRYETPDNWFRLIDFTREDNVWQWELEHIKAYYLAQDWLSNSGSRLLHYFEENAIMDQFIDDLYSFFNNINQIVDYDGIRRMYKVLTIECGQGLALDTDADLDNGTPTHTGSENLIPWLKFVSGSCAVNRYYVSRSYITRHGSGELYDEDPEMFFEDQTNIPNEFQGTIRFAPMSELNTQLLIDRITSDIKKINTEVKNNLVITHTNEIEPSTEFIDKMMKLSFDQILFSNNKETIEV